MTPSTARADYCVVGPTLALIGGADRSAARALTVRAELPRGRTIAELSAARHDSVIVIDEPREFRRMDDDAWIEAMRLFARTCADFWGYRLPFELRLHAQRNAAVDGALRADGFSSGDGRTWSRDAALFQRPGPKARSVDDLYGDLYSIPWNFVPREYDVYGALLDQAPPSSATVLDLGCGLGKNATALEARGWRVCGLDLARAAVRRCRDLVLQPRRFVVAAAAHVPWRSGRFEHVLDVGMLHCMEPADRRMAVEEIARVLTPGGWLHSRFFKPRPAAWTAMYPMQVREFGLTAGQVRALFDGALVCESIEEGPSVIYVKARRPRA